MKHPQRVIPSLKFLAALLATVASISTLAGTASTNYEKRDRDWRNGAIVYQVLVDRFVPSARLDAKRALYAAPKVLRDWSVLTPKERDLGGYSRYKRVK